MVVVTLQSIEITNADIDYSFYICRKWSRNFNVLSHVSITFLYIDFKQYGAVGLFRFSLAFGLASNEVHSQRAAKSFLAFMLSFMKMVTSRHIDEDMPFIDTTTSSWSNTKTRFKYGKLILMFFHQLFREPIAT
jgi:hypothetical protein